MALPGMGMGRLAVQFGGHFVGQLVGAVLIILALAGTGRAQAPFPAEPTGPRLMVAKSRVVPGDEINVPVKLGAAPDVGVVQLELTYDAKELKLKSIEKGAMLSEHSTIEADTQSPGRATVRINSAQQPLDGDGELFKARFATSDRARQAGHTLNLENVRAWRVARSQGDAPSEESEVQLSVYPGVLRVTDRPVSIWVMGAIGAILCIVLYRSFMHDGPAVESNSADH